MTLELNSGHVSEALELLIQQFKTKDGMRAFLASYVRQVQLLEDASFELLTGRWIDNAAGELLDFLGRLVGQERLGLTDDEYRPLVRARIRLNIGSATGEDVIAVMLQAARSTTPVLTERYPAAFVVELLGELLESVSIIASMLDAARAAGVDAQMIYSLGPTGEMFSFATAAIPEAATNGWANAAQTTGGRLAGVIA